MFSIVLLQTPGAIPHEQTTGRGPVPSSPRPSSAHPHPTAHSAAHSAAHGGTGHRAGHRRRAGDGARRRFRHRLDGWPARRAVARRTIARGLVAGRFPMRGFAMRRFSVGRSAMGRTHRVVSIPVVPVVVVVVIHVVGNPADPNLLVIARRGAGTQNPCGGKKWKRKREFAKHDGADYRSWAFPQPKKHPKSPKKPRHPKSPAEPICGC